MTAQRIGTVFSEQIKRPCGLFIWCAWRDLHRCFASADLRLISHSTRSRRYSKLHRSFSLYAPALSGSSPFYYTKKDLAVFLFGAPGGTYTDASHLPIFVSSPIRLDPVATRNSTGVSRYTLRPFRVQVPFIILKKTLRSFYLVRLEGLTQMLRICRSLEC